MTREIILSINLHYHMRQVVAVTLLNFLYDLITRHQLLLACVTTCVTYLCERNKNK